MLQKIHDKVSGLFAGFLLALLAIVFVFWGVDYGFSGAAYAVKVKIDGRHWWEAGEKISLQAVREAYQSQQTRYQQIMRGELPAPMKASLQADILDSFVRRELLTQQAELRGYRVRNQDVVNAIARNPAFQIEGKFDPDHYRVQLRDNGRSVATFEAETRKQLEISQLPDALAASAFVTPGELERQWKLQKEQREASWLVIPATRFMDAIKPDDAAIKAHYDQHQDQYKTPETVALRYIELKVADVAAEIKVTDEDLRNFYETVKDRYADDKGNPKPLDQVRAEVEKEYRTQEAEKRFGDLQEKLANKAFESLNNLDAVAGELGLKVQEIAEFRRDIGGGALGAKPAVLEAAFSEEVLGGENSKPLELEPGHVVVLRVSAHRAAEPRPLESVRESIVEVLKTEQSRQQARDLAQRSAAQMQAGKENLERLAAEFKTKAEGPRFVGREDATIPVELRNALFATPHPQDGQPLFRPVALGNGDAAILKFSAVRVDSTPETAEQRAARLNQLREQWAGTEFDAYLRQLERNASIARNPKAFE